MTTLLTAEEVQARLRVRSRAAAISLMARLPHIDLARQGAKQRQLRVTADTLEAFMQGRIALDEPNVIPMPRRQTRAPEPTARGGKKRIPEIVPLRR